MIKTVIKRDGSQEAFTAEKINGWSIWASEKLGDVVSWPEVVLHVVSTLPEICTSEQIQNTAIKFCLDKSKWEYNLMAGRLYSSLMIKQIHNGKHPTVKELHTKMLNAGIMVKLDYSDEEYAQVEKMINHDLDMHSAHYSLHQCRYKYSLRDKVRGIEYETPQFVYMRMAMAFAENEPRETRMADVAKFYEHISKKRINVPTNYYVNAGTVLDGYSSCCVYTTGDSWPSLAAGDHIAYAMTAMSAGIGAHIKTRSIKDGVRNGIIEHQGKLPYYRALVGAINANLQNGRGGAATVHYSAYDPEVAVIQKLKNPMTPLAKQVRGVDYSFGSDKFIARLAARDQQVALFSYKDAPELYEARYSKDGTLFEKLYNEFLKSAKPRKMVSAREVVIGALTEGYQTGRHYLHFTDAMNSHTPFKEPIYSSNLCVAPETLVLTDRGHKEIKTLVDTEVNVWNGSEWSAVTIRKTGENQKLMKVTTDSGFEIDCTPYHKFYVADGYKGRVIEKRAHELVAGDKLIKCVYPTIQGEQELQYAYENGLFSAEGCNTKQGDRIYLYGTKRKLRSVLNDDIFGKWTVQDNYNREYAHTDSLLDKFFVPSADYSVKSRLDWFAGLCDGDGTVTTNGNAQSIQIVSVNNKFLKDIQLMLQTLGVYSKITDALEGGMYDMPANDGTGGKKQYECKPAWRILIAHTGVNQLLTHGLKTHRLELEMNDAQNWSATHYVKVTQVVDTGRIDDTYCFTEPKRHMGVFNGMLLGQCSEISLPTRPFSSVKELYEDYKEGGGEVALCNIAAIIPTNITSDEMYAEVAYYTLKMVSIGIHKSSYVFKTLEHSAKSRMNAGIGIVGLAHLMARNNKRYSTQEGRDFIHETFETHAWHLYNASLKLGKERGNAPWMHKTLWPEGWTPLDTYEKRVDSLVTVPNRRDWEHLRKEIVKNGGIHNSVCVAMMPSESSSILSETTNGVYPIRDFDLIKTNDTMATYYVVPESTELRDNYECAWDISQSDLAKCYAIMQKWTDQAISADLYRKMQGDEKVGTKEMLDTYLDFVRYGIKTRYYQNSLTAKGIDLDSSATVSAVDEPQPDDEPICESCSI